MFSGANGPLNGAGSGRAAVVSIALVMSIALVVRLIDDDVGAAVASRVNVRRSGPEVEFIEPNVLDGFSVDELFGVLPCEIPGVDAGNDALRVDGLAELSAWTFGSGVVVRETSP